VTIHTPARRARSSWWGVRGRPALVPLVLVPAIAEPVRLVEVFGGAPAYMLRLPCGSSMTASLSLGRGGGRIL